jgi:hypothetical protein
MNKQIQEQNLRELARLTFLNILSANGVIYTHYKLKKERESYENNINKSKWL